VCTILILDDDASIRFLYEEELRDEGYDVVSENGEACIEDLVLRKRPDLISGKLGHGFDVVKSEKRPSYFFGRGHQKLRIGLVKSRNSLFLSFPQRRESNFQALLDSQRE
jgi:hypothetical protein